MELRACVYDYYAVTVHKIYIFLFQFHFASAHCLVYRAKIYSNNENNNNNNNNLIVEILLLHSELGIFHGWESQNLFFSFCRASAKSTSGWSSTQRCNMKITWTDLSATIIFILKIMRISHFVLIFFRSSLHFLISLFGHFNIYFHIYNINIERALKNSLWMQMEGKHTK